MNCCILSVVNFLKNKPAGSNEVDFVAVHQRPRDCITTFFVVVVDVYLSIILHVQLNCCYIC